jgi:hypothetical protein
MVVSLTPKIYLIYERKISFFFSFVLLTKVSQIVEYLLDNPSVHKTGNVGIKVILRRLNETTVAVEEE